MGALATLREIADAFNDADRIADPAAREARFQVLRSHRQGGLVRSEVSVSRGKTAIFGAQGIAHFRVLLALAEAGFKGPALARMNAKLTETALCEGPGRHPAQMIGVAAQGIAAGEEWTLELCASRHVPSGEIQYLGGLRRCDDPRDPTVEEILRSTYRPLTTIRIDLADLVRPVLDLIAERAG